MSDDFEKTDNLLPDEQMHSDESADGLLSDQSSEDRQKEVQLSGTEETDDTHVLPEDNMPALEPNASEPESFVIRRVRTEPESNLPPKEQEKGFMYAFLDTLRFICLGLIIGILLVVFVIQRNDVYGSSMEPTLHQGDAVFVEMISAYTNSFDKGDIVTIDATGMEGYDQKEKIIKRIIAEPGDTVSIYDGQVYVNGVLLEEDYLADGTKTYVNADGVAKGYDEITLGDDQYYVFGDNRGACLDSRVLGTISDDQIKSKVIAKIYPFDDARLF